MKPETANKINLYLNKPEITELLNEYAEVEISRLLNQLEFSTDLANIRYLQGQIFELRKLSKLRETAINVIDSERKSRTWQNEHSKP